MSRGPIALRVRVRAFTANGMEDHLEGGGTVWSDVTELVVLEPEIHRGALSIVHLNGAPQIGPWRDVGAVYDITVPAEYVEDRSQLASADVVRTLRRVD